MKIVYVNANKDFWKKVKKERFVRNLNVIIPATAVLVVKATSVLNVKKIELTNKVSVNVRKTLMKMAKFVRNVTKNVWNAMVLEQKIV